MKRSQPSRPGFAMAMLLVAIAAGPSRAHSQTAVSPGPRAAEAKQAQRDELLKTVKELRQRGKYEEALESAKRLVELDGALFGAGDLHRAESLNELSQALAATDSKYLDEAIERGKEGLKIRQDAHDQSSRACALAQIDVAVLHGNSGDLDGAIDQLQAAATVLAASVGKNDPDYARALIDLAKFRWDRGDPHRTDFLDARNYYRTAMPIFVKAELQETRDYADMIMNLGLLRLSESEFDQAKDHLEEAVRFYTRASRKLNPDDLEYHATQFGLGVALQNLGHYYQEAGHFERAAPLFRQAAGIVMGMRGADEKTAYVAMLINLTLLYQNMRDLARAEATGLESVASVRRLVGKAHPYYVVATHNLAGVLRDARSLDRAKTYYERALAACGNNDQRARVHDSLGQLEAEMGEPSVAERHLRESYALHVGLHGKEHREVARSLEHLGEFFLARGDLQSAANFIAEGYAQLSYFLPGGHPQRIKAARNLGPPGARRTGKPGQAAVTLEEVVDSDAGALEPNLGNSVGG